MAGTRDDGNSGHNFCLSFDQLHLARINQWIVIVAEIAHAIALQLQLSVPPFAFGCVVFCLGEGGNGVPVAIYSVPAAMVEMEMRVDDDVNVFRSRTSFAEAVQQLFRRLPDSFLLFLQLVADAGFDQHIELSGAYQH